MKNPGIQSNNRIFALGGKRPGFEFTSPGPLPAGPHGPGLEYMVTAATLPKRFHAPHLLIRDNHLQSYVVPLSWNFRPALLVKCHGRPQGR